MSSLHLSNRFCLLDGSIRIEYEIYDPLTYLLSLTMCVNPIFADNGSFVWKLATGKYRVYVLLESQPHVSTEIRTPPYSSTSTFNTPPAVRVKIELGIPTVIHLSDSSDGVEPVHSAPNVVPSSSSFGPPSVSPPLCTLIPCVIFPHPLPNTPLPFFKVFVLLLPCPVGKTSSRS